MAGDYDNENPYDNMSQHTTETTTKDSDEIISVKSAAGTKSPMPGKLELGLRNWFCPHSSNYVREIVHAQKNWGCFLRGIYFHGKKPSQFINQHFSYKIIFFLDSDVVKTNPIETNE